MKRKNLSAAASGSSTSIGVSWFQNGNCWYTPGSFRKSGKHRTCGIRNLEECVTAWKQRGEFEYFRARSACKDVKKRGAKILKELEGPLGGGAWLGRHGRTVPT